MECHYLTSKQPTPAVLSMIPSLKPRKLFNLNKLNKFRDKIEKAPLEALAIHKESLEKITNMELELKAANKALAESNELSKKANDMAIKADSRAEKAGQKSIIAIIISLISFLLSLLANAVTVFPAVRDFFGA